MTVSAQNSYISYTGNGSTTAYSWPYKLFAATDLKVYTVVIATGVETLQTSGGSGTYDYNINSDLDTVTLNNNLPATHKLFLTRIQALEQPTDYIEGDAFPAAVHEDTLDKIVLQLQQHEEQLKRALKFKQSTATRSEPAIPELAADKIIKMNAAGDGFETQSTADVSTVAGIASDITTVSGIAANVTAVAADASDIGTVATNIASVNTVSTNIAKVQTVANDLNEAVSEIETVAADLQEATPEIDTVAGAIANVNTVGTGIANVNLVAGQISPTNNISTLGGISSDITTLAGTSGLSTLAANSANITTCANNNTNITNVGSNIADVTSVANNLAAVQNFADVYRIASSAPGTSLNVGDLYFDTTANELKVYKSSGWAAAGSTVNGTSQRYNYTATAAQTTFTGADTNGNTLAYDAGYADVYLNGVRLSGADITITSGTSVVFAAGASAGDILDIVAYGTFNVASVNAANIDAGTLNAARLPKAIIGSWESKSANFTAVEGKGYFCNTSGGAIDVTLPASPTAGDTIRFVDEAATFDTNDLTLLAGSGKIQGAAANLDVAIERAAFAIVYCNSTQGWLLTEK